MEQKRQSGAHYRWYQNVTVSANPELYELYRRVNKKLTGDKRQVFEDIRAGLETIRNDKENHVVLIMHGISHIGERYSYALSHEGEDITFDELKLFLKSISGKYNIKTFTLAGCNVPASAASEFKQALGADVYYSDTITGSSYIDYGATVERVDKTEEFDTDYRGEPLFRYTYKYKTTPYSPTRFKWKLPVKDPETGADIIDPKTGEKTTRSTLTRKLDSYGTICSSYSR